MGKPGGGDKKQQLFDAIVNQKLQAVRWGVANAGVAPATRDGDGHTTFMIACLNGKDRSLAEMVRWYERRLSQLRECLEQVDEDDGRTCFHMAAAHPNGHKCVHELLDAWLTVDKNRRDAGLKRRDRRGKTPYDVATAKSRAAIDEWLKEPETESDDDEVGADGMTSTQRSKAKKKALLEKERAGAAPPPPPSAADEAAAAAAAPERGEFKEGTPTPTWPEVEKWAQSVKDLKPICELTVAREDALPLLPPAAAGEPSSVVDPALYWCESVNRLSLKLGPQLTFLSDGGLAKLANLTHLIVASNGLEALPPAIAGLPLKSIDASYNKLAALPEAMPFKTLEALDVSGNAIPTLSPALDGCCDLVTLAVDGNAIASLDGLPFDKFKRLVTFTAGANALADLPEALGDLAKLETLSLNGNKELAALPCALAKCKKLKEIRVDDCAIADNKVLGYIQKGEMKQLAKYFEKTAAKGGGGKKGGGKKGKR